MRIDPLQQAGVGEGRGQRLLHCLPQVVAIEGLGQRLERQHIVVLVDDQSGQQVGLAEDDAVGIGIAREAASKFDRAGNSLPDQLRQSCVGDIVAADQPDRDLRSAAVERGPEPAAALIANLHQRCGRSIGRRHQVRAIDP